MYQLKYLDSCRMRITDFLKLSFFLFVFFAFHLTCSNYIAEPKEFGSIHIEIVLSNDLNQNSKQETENEKQIIYPNDNLLPEVDNVIFPAAPKKIVHDRILTIKDVIRTNKAKTFSSDITNIMITVSGMDPINVDLSSELTVSETIEEVPVGQQSIKVDCKNTAGTILYSQTQTVQVLSGETSSPSFSAENFIPENCSISIISPNGGETWELGSTHEILWNSSHSSLNVKIELVVGGTISQTIAADEINDGTYSWEISSLDAGTDYTVRISYTSPPDIWDESDNNFTIGDENFSGDIIVISPNGGESWQLGSTHQILWNSSHSSLNVKIELFVGGALLQTISSDEINDGTYSWDISVLDEGMHYLYGVNSKVRISYISHPDIWDESDEDFTLWQYYHRWMQTGLTSGIVYDLAINSQGHLFAGENGSLYRSVDFGSTWQITGDFDANGFNQGDQRIAITESDRILVTEDTSIRISDDNGITWSYANMETNHSFERVESIAIAPDGSIYAGRLQDWGCTTCGIFKSTDGGNNFSWVFQAPYEDEAFVRFAFKPDGQIFAGSLSWGNHQMYRSIDGGSSWNYADTGLIGSVQDIIITNSGRILVNMSGSPNPGFYASDDDGSSWYQIGGGDPIQNFEGGMVIDSDNNIYAFKSLWDGDIIGYQSEDDGDSWQPISWGAIFDFDINHSPRSSLITPSGFIFVGTDGNGIIRTMGNFR